MLSLLHLWSLRSVPPAHRWELLPLTPSTNWMCDPWSPWWWRVSQCVWGTCIGTMHTSRSPPAYWWESRLLTPSTNWMPHPWSPQCGFTLLCLRLVLGRNSKLNRNSIQCKLSNTFYLLFSLPQHRQILCWRSAPTPAEIFQAIEKSTLEILCDFVDWFLQGVLQVGGGFWRGDS